MLNLEVAISTTALDVGWQRASMVLHVATDIRPEEGLSAKNFLVSCANHPVAALVVSHLYYYTTSAPGYYRLSFTMQDDMLSVIRARRLISIQVIVTALNGRCRRIIEPL